MLRTELSTDHMCLPSYLPCNLSTYPCASTWNTIAHLHNVRQGPHTSYIRTCTHTTIFLPTYLPLSLSRSLSLSLSLPYPTYPTLRSCLSTHPPTCLPTFLPTCRPTCLPTYLHGHSYERDTTMFISACWQTTYLPSYMCRCARHTYIPTYVHTYIFTYIHTYIHPSMHSYIAIAAAEHIAAVSVRFDLG